MTTDEIKNMLQTASLLADICADTSRLMEKVHETPVQNSLLIIISKAHEAKKQILAAIDTKQPSNF